MLVELLTTGFMLSQDPIAVVSEPPVPFYDGAKRFAACGRVEVEINYFNSSAKGLQKLEGKASFSHKGKSINDVLGRIQAESSYVDRIGFWCEAENVINVAIDAVSKEGGEARWILTVDERLEAKLSGPEPFDEESRPQRR